MSALHAYRDDGPLGEALGRASRRLRLPATPALVVALVLLSAGLVVDRGGVGAATSVGLIAYIVLATVGELGTQRIDWLTPPLLRLGEYGFAIAVTAIGEPNARPAAYGLLLALAFHHYDVAYRLRHQKRTPPDWLRRAGGGWELRMILVAILTLLGIQAMGIAVLAVWLGVLFLGESIASWVRLREDVDLGTSMVDDEEAIGDED